MFSLILGAGVLCAAPGISSCAGNATKTAKTEQQSLKPQGKKGRVGGPQLGTPGGGPVIDKTGDAVLQAMIQTEVPEFRQHTYNDAVTGKSLHYNLFIPRNVDEKKSYPLVLFMADASTPGTDVTRPLTQGYGALVRQLKNGRQNIRVIFLCLSIPGWPSTMRTSIPMKSIW